MAGIGEELDGLRAARRDEQARLRALLEALAARIDRLVVDIDRRLREIEDAVAVDPQ